MGCVDYYLIALGLCTALGQKTHGVSVGPGRGSGARSMSCLSAIGIIGIDPMKYGLIFERFLNPES